MAVETVQAKLKVTNKAQFERFTVQNFPKFSSLYEFELVGLRPFDCHMQLPKWVWLDDENSFEH